MVLKQEENNNWYELEARYDSRASFYGKARIELTGDGTQRLWSYNTHVASIKRDVKPMVFDDYSATTLRHIKEFLQQNGWKADTKKQILADYGEEAHKQAWQIIQQKIVDNQL